MRILYHHRTLADGAEGIHIREMIKAFRSLGHELRVVALVGEGSEAGSGTTRRVSGWSRVSGWLPGGVYELAELGYNVIGGRAVRRAIREFHPDLVYDRYNSYSTAAVVPASRAGIPVFLEVNAPVAFERENFDGPELRWPRMAQRYERSICRQATHIFAVSTPLREFLITERGVPPEKITVLPNGADPQSFDAQTDGMCIRQRYNLGNRIVIGFVGILRPWHGVDDLLVAFSRLSPQSRNLHLLLVGDGPIESHLKAQVNRLGLVDCVTFTGRVRHCEIQQHIAAMSVAVSPRATFYASPMKILEYMAMAVPVVAPRMPNICDICDDGRDSMLFEPEDAGSMERTLERLISNRGEAQRLGAAARDKIERRLNWRRNAEEVVARARLTSIRAAGGQFVV